MKDLYARQQTLINLITRVGGRQNIQKWTDELLKIDVKLENKEVNKMIYTYKGYSVVQSGDGAGLHFEGKKVNSEFVAIYRIDGYESHKPEDIKEVTKEMVSNASYYYEARQQDKLKDKYEAYKKAQGNKPVKPFQKWLQTVT